MRQVRHIQQALRESYARENVMLLQYLKQRPLNVYDHRHNLSDGMWDKWDGVLRNVGSSAEVFKEMTALDQEDEVVEVCHKVDEWLDSHPEAKMDAGQTLAQHDPVEAPTWAILDLNVERLLPSTTWLVHWTNEARAVAKEGFTKGTMDVEGLGLTTYRSMRSKSLGGYNFAFTADSHYAENPKRKYGKECVVFQSSGVECSHSGDEEDQVIFWGESITTPPVAIVEDKEDDEGRWMVLSKAGKPLVRLAGPAECQDWVVKHHAQYRKQLYT